MPSKTPAQARLMAAVAHNRGFAKKVGIPQSVGREFNQADAGTGILKRAEGGATDTQILSHYLDNLIANVTQIEDTTPFTQRYGNSPTFNNPIGFLGKPVLRQRAPGGGLGSPFEMPGLPTQDVGDVLPFVKRNPNPMNLTEGARTFYGGSNARVGSPEWNSQYEAQNGLNPGSLKESNAGHGDIVPLPQAPKLTEPLGDYEPTQAALDRLGKLMGTNPRFMDIWSTLNPADKELYLRALETGQLPPKRADGGKVDPEFWIFKKGDTPSAVAKRLHVPVSTLLALNGIADVKKGSPVPPGMIPAYRIPIGFQFRLRPATPPPPPMDKAKGPVVEDTAGQGDDTLKIPSVPGGQEVPLFNQTSKNEGQPAAALKPDKTWKEGIEEKPKPTPPQMEIPIEVIPPPQMHPTIPGSKPQTEEQFQAGLEQTKNRGFLDKYGDSIARDLMGLLDAGAMTGTGAAAPFLRDFSGANAFHDEVSPIIQRIMSKSYPWGWVGKNHPLSSIKNGFEPQMGEMFGPMERGAGPSLGESIPSNLARNRVIPDKSLPNGNAYVEPEFADGGNVMNNPFSFNQDNQDPMEMLRSIQEQIQQMQQRMQPAMEYENPLGGGFTPMPNGQNGMMRQAMPQPQISGSGGKGSFMNKKAGGGGLFHSPSVSIEDLPPPRPMIGPWQTTVSHEPQVDQYTAGPQYQPPAETAVSMQDPMHRELEPGLGHPDEKLLPLLGLIPALRPALAAKSMYDIVNQVPEGYTIPKNFRPPRSRFSTPYANKPVQGPRNTPDLQSRVDKMDMPMWKQYLGDLLAQIGHATGGEVPPEHPRATGRPWSSPSDPIDEEITQHYLRKAPLTYAGGGNLGTPDSSKWVSRLAAGQTAHNRGFLHSSVPGRTDKIGLNVKSGSYVIPADVVSGHGQGNSLAGAQRMDALFKQGPYGTSASKIGVPRSSPPRLMGMKRAEGGEVPVLAAGGEYILSPEQVANVGKGDPERGFRILDQFVLNSRKKHITDLRGLKPPRKD